MTKLIDLTGQRFGRLFVIERCERPKNRKRGTFWNCICDCGNKRIVETGSLRSGSAQSCGCLRDERVSEAKLIDLTGKRFGRLVVIEKAQEKKYDKVFWHCKCDCGREINTAGASLTRGFSQSCGCYFDEIMKLPPYQSSINQLFHNYKVRARKKNIEFSIDKEIFITLTKKNCFYCGTEPHQVYKCKGGGEDYLYNGLDRIDNSEGYTIDNVVPCCGRCNWAKKHYSQDDFFSWIDKVYNYSLINVKDKNNEFSESHN